MCEGQAQHWGSEPNELRKAHFGNNKTSNHSVSHLQSKVDGLKKKEKVCYLSLAKGENFGRILNDWMIPVRTMTLLNIFDENTNLNYC